MVERLSVIDEQCSNAFVVIQRSVPHMSHSSQRVGGRTTTESTELSGIKFICDFIEHSATSQ
jgi:hypothetical protein